MSSKILIPIIIIAIMLYVIDAHNYNTNRENMTRIHRGVGDLNTGDETPVAAGIVNSYPIFDYTHTYGGGRSCDECPSKYMCPDCPQYSLSSKGKAEEGFLAINKLTGCYTCGDTAIAQAALNQGYENAYANERITSAIRSCDYNHALGVDEKIYSYDHLRDHVGQPMLEHMDSKAPYLDIAEHDPPQFTDYDPTFMQSRERVGACSGKTSSYSQYMPRDTHTATNVESNIGCTNEIFAHTPAITQRRNACGYSDDQTINMLYHDAMGLEYDGLTSADCIYTATNKYIYKEPCIYGVEPRPY